MKVVLGTVEVSETMRKAIRHHYGQSGLATREEVKQAYLSSAEADLEIMKHEYEESIQKKEDKNANTE